MKRAIDIASIISAIVFSVLLAAPAQAAEPRWQRIGPYGHDGYRLFPSGDPSILYVNSSSSLYRSEDGGQSWREVSPLFLEVLSVDPRDPDRLFGAYNFEGKILRSADGGRTFQPASDGFVDQQGEILKTLFFLRHPTNPDVVFAQTNRGLFRFDGAGRWELIAFGGSEVWGFAIDPLAPEVWHASIADGNRQELAEMWISTDAGATWSPAATKPGVTGAVLLSPIFFDPVRPHRAYGLANCRPAVFSEGAWRLLPLRASGYTCVMTITEKGRLVGPLDHGAGDNRPQRMVMSDDGGATWALRGTPKDDTSEIAAVGAGEALVAVGLRGLWRSADGGATWRASSRGISGFIIGDLAVAADGTVFASTRDEGVYRSRDAGRSWQRRVRGLHADWWDSPVLAVDPRDASVVWAGMNMLHRSRDGGQSWQGVPLPRLRLPLIKQILIDPVREGVVYVRFTEWDPELYRLLDDGRTWQPLARLPTGADGLTVAPSDGTLYAWGWSLGLFVSTDAGSSWQRIRRSVPTFIETFAVDPEQSNVLWLSNREDGVFRSTDGGRTFVNLTKDEPLLSPVGSLAFDPADPAHPYLGFEAQGIYQWRGNGWQKVGADDEAFEGNVYGPLAFDAKRGLLYAWTLRGIYRLRLK